MRREVPAREIPASSASSLLGERGTIGDEVEHKAKRRWILIAAYFQRVLRAKRCTDQSPRVSGLWRGSRAGRGAPPPQNKSKKRAPAERSRAARRTLWPTARGRCGSDQFAVLWMRLLNFAKNRAVYRRRYKLS